MSRATERIAVMLLASIAMIVTASAQESGPLLPPPLDADGPTDTAAPHAVSKEASDARRTEQQHAQLAQALSDLLVQAIPAHYEKKRNWGRTKSITTGLRTTGSGLDIRIKRRKKDVPHGDWKHYRITLVDPDEKLQLAVTELRPVEPGKAIVSLALAADVHGWGRTRHYNRGLHLLTLSAETTTRMHLQLACEITIATEIYEGVPSVVVRPRVTDAKLTLRDFRLHRISKADGPLVRELGKGIKHVIEDGLEPHKLTKKLNRAIDKKRDRLRFSPAEILESGWAELVGG